MAFFARQNNFKEYLFSVSYKPGVWNVVTDLFSHAVHLNENVSTTDDELSVRKISGDALLDALLLNDVADA